MRVEISETDHNLHLVLVPETVEDFSKLIRFTRNSKKKVPEYYLSVSRHNTNPYLSIVMPKISISKQINSIKPGLK